MKKIGRGLLLFLHLFGSFFAMIIALALVFSADIVDEIYNLTTKGPKRPTLDNMNVRMTKKIP